MTIEGIYVVRIRLALSGQAKSSPFAHARSEDGNGLKIAISIKMLIQHSNLTFTN